MQKDINIIPDSIDKELYNFVKNNPENYEDWFVGLVGFCASYNGKWFGGYANNVKTKLNTIRNYTDESIRNIKSQAPALKGIKFKCEDFRNIHKIKDFLIYCDIPYKNTTKYSSCKIFPYEDFSEWCRELSKNNIILISEYSMPSDFVCIWEKEVKTTMNNSRISNDKKNKRVEKLFMIDNRKLR